MPNSMVSRICNDRDKLCTEIDFSVCRDIPFVVVAQPQEMRRYFDNLCAEHNLVPQIAVEVAGGVTSAWSMARAGIGATLLPLQFVDKNQFDKNLTLFSLKNVVFTRQPAIVTRRGQYISPYAQYAIELLAAHRSISGL